MNHGPWICAAVVASSTAACSVQETDVLPDAAPAVDTGIDAGVRTATVTLVDAGVAPSDQLDVQRAKAKFASTDEVMRRIIAPTCAAENNECHANENFPDLSTEANLWGLVELRCNQGVGERTSVENFCEAQGDELRIEDGVNAGFVTRIGSIEEIKDGDGEFVRYEVRVDRGPPEPQGNAQFVLLRHRVILQALGGGRSLVTDGSTTLHVTRARDLLGHELVRQGDENRDGVFGDGRGVLVRTGDARNSYLIRRLAGAGTDRLRMPLNFNSDNPTEVNRVLTREEMYVLMSWINCMRPDDRVYAPVRFDCPENAGNDGAW